MDLLLHRRRRRGLFNKPVYRLDAQLRVTEAESATIARQGLATRHLYRRADLVDAGQGLLGLLFRLGFDASNLTLTASDLMQGWWIETANLSEVLAVEDLIRGAVATFSQLVAAAATFDGDDVLRL
jgi:hypothetical protein